MVAGSNALYINEKNNYVEIFAGLENILKVFRVDFVAAYDNGIHRTATVRVGTGGILGGNIHVNRSENTASVNF